jgi:hypothetical protein
MATAVTSPSTDAIDIKTSNETYRVYVKLDAEGKKIDKIQIGTAGKDNSFWNKMDAPEVTDEKGVKTPNTWIKGLEQTLRIPNAGTWDGARLLVADEEEAVNIFNRGAKQKINQKTTAKLGEISDDGTQLVFEPIEGAVDTTEWLNEPTQRRNLTDGEKSLRMLKAAVDLNFGHLSEAEKAAKVEQMLALFQ